MEGSIVRRSADAALAFAGGTAVIGRSTFIANQVAVQVESSHIIEDTDRPSEPVTNSVVLYLNTFRDNQFDRRDTPIPYPRPISF